MNKNKEITEITEITEDHINSFSLKTKTDEIENLDWFSVEKCFFKNGNLRKCYMFKYDIGEDGAFQRWNIKLAKEWKGNKN